MTDTDPTRCGDPEAAAVTRGEIDSLAAQLRALTDAIDRLGARIDCIASGSSVAVSWHPEPDDVDADPFAWPTEVEIARYRAGRGPGDSS